MQNRWALSGVGGSAWKDLLGDTIMVTRRTPLTSMTALRDKGVYWLQPREEALGLPKEGDGVKTQRIGYLGVGQYPAVGRDDSNFIMKKKKTADASFLREPQAG